MIRAVIIDQSDEFLKKAERFLTSARNIQVIKSTLELSLVDSLISEHQPSVLILGPSFKVDESLPFAEVFSVESPDIGLIWVAKDLTSDLLIQSLRAGFKDLVAITGLANLPASVYRTSETVSRLREAIAKGGGPEKDEMPSAPGKQAKVVAVFSTKGGVGKTFIASNLAVGLARETKSTVILVDLDLHFGDVGVMLHLVPKRTISDILPVFDRLDAEMVKGFLAPHSSGVEVLLAPIQPDDAEKLNAAHIEKIFKVLKEIADYIVVDTPPALNDTTLAALDNSEEIYLVATMDVPSIKNVKISLQTMKLLGYSEEKIKLLLNRADSKVSLQPREVEKSLSKNISVSIPSDRLVPQSINEGFPVILSQTRSAVPRSLYQLVDLVKKNSVSQKEAENVFKRQAS